jgi:hypothetical protein
LYPRYLVGFASLYSGENLVIAYPSGEHEFTHDTWWVSRRYITTFLYSVCCPLFVMLSFFILAIYWSVILLLLITYLIYLQTFLKQYVVKGVFFVVRFTLVPASYLSAPSAVHSYRVPGKFIRRLKSLFVG